MSQTANILKHMKKYRTINPMQALKLYRCFRLAARIDDLRNDGYAIQTHMVEKNGTRFAKYEYVGPLK
jgi:hypothetical protein